MRSGGNNNRYHGKTTFLSGVERPFSILFFVCIFMFSVVAAVSVRAAETDHQGIVNCDIQQNPCRQKLADTEVVLDINPKPVKAMTDLKFRITLSGKQPVKPPYIDLGMPGMKMGPNRVSLEPRGEGVYEGTGIIVRCPSGKRVWKARVTVPETGSVEFVFDVIY
ncbi:MAG: hypothetical protein JRI75_08705 [Deltaproteobacteria bacterium]|nr:hypothetical protein [Deltaproteobacteria bacterium]